MKTYAESKPPTWRRWLNVALRCLHLSAVIILGAGLLGAAIQSTNAALAVAATGLGMFALDTLTHPGHLREASGIAMIAKLALVIWMAVDANVRPVLYWLIVVGSAVFAHAPARFRHADLFPVRRGG